MWLCGSHCCDKRQLWVTYLGGSGGGTTHIWTLFLLQCEHSLIWNVNVKVRCFITVLIFISLHLDHVTESSSCNNGLVTATTVKPCFIFKWVHISQSQECTPAALLPDRLMSEVLSLLVSYSPSHINFHPHFSLVDKAASHPISPLWLAPETSSG